VQNTWTAVSSMVSLVLYHLQTIIQGGHYSKIMFIIGDSNCCSRLPIHSSLTVYASKLMTITFCFLSPHVHTPTLTYRQEQLNWSVPHLPRKQNLDYPAKLAVSIHPHWLSIKTSLRRNSIHQYNVQCQHSTPSLWDPWLSCSRKDLRLVCRWRTANLGLSLGVLDNILLLRSGCP
jgi:hypothetical protein